MDTVYDFNNIDEFTINKNVVTHKDERFVITSHEANVFAFHFDEVGNRQYLWSQGYAQWIMAFDGTYPEQVKIEAFVGARGLIQYRDGKGQLHSQDIKLDETGFYTCLLRNFDTIKEVMLFANHDSKSVNALFRVVATSS